MKRMSPKTNRIAQNLTEMPNRNKEFVTGGEGGGGRGYWNEHRARAQAPEVQTISWSGDHLLFRFGACSVVYSHFHLISN